MQKHFNRTRDQGVPHAQVIDPTIGKTWVPPQQYEGESNEEYIKRRDILHQRERDRYSQRLADEKRDRKAEYDAYEIQRLKDKLEKNSSHNLNMFKKNEPEPKRKEEVKSEPSLFEKLAPKLIEGGATLIGNYLANRKKNKK
jgi:hypothetical protein